MVTATAPESIDIAALARIGEALANDIRRAVLAQLATGARYPAELATELGVGRTTLSNHLACLRGCGLVRSTSEGRRSKYELADPAIGAALVAVSRLPLAPCPDHLTSRPGDHQ